MKKQTIWAIVIVVVVIAIIIYFYNRGATKMKYGGIGRRNIACSPHCPQGKYCNTELGECKPATERFTKTTTPKGRKEIGTLCEEVTTWTDVKGKTQSSTCHGKIGVGGGCEGCTPW